MADIRQAERRAQGGEEVPVQSEGVHGASMQWTADAKEALKGLTEGSDGKVVLLVSSTDADWTIAAETLD